MGLEFTFSSTPRGTDAAAVLENTCLYQLLLSNKQAYHVKWLKVITIQPGHGSLQMETSHGKAAESWLGWTQTVSWLTICPAVSGSQAGPVLQTQKLISFITQHPRKPLDPVEES